MKTRDVPAESHCCWHQRLLPAKTRLTRHTIYRRCAGKTFDSQDILTLLQLILFFCWFFLMYHFIRHRNIINFRYVNAIIKLPIKLPLWNEVKISLGIWFHYWRFLNQYRIRTPGLYPWTTAEHFFGTRGNKSFFITCKETKSVRVWQF